MPTRPRGPGRRRRRSTASRSTRAWILDAIAGPVATTTFTNALFFKPPPPRGIGIACTATDIFSYLQVRVTRAALTITPKDMNGRLVQELGGAPCGPFTITPRE